MAIRKLHMQKKTLSRSLLPLPQITLSGYCMTSLPIHQIRFNVTYITEKSVPQPNPENCKGAKENNLNVSVSWNSCFNYHAVDWFYSNRHNSLLVLLAMPLLREKGSSAVQGPAQNSRFIFRSLNKILWLREPVLLCCINILHSYLPVRSLFCPVHSKISDVSSNSKTVPFIFSWKCWRYLI